MASGDATLFGRTAQLIHPELEVVDADDGGTERASRIIPIYPATEGLSQRMLRKIQLAAWDRYRDEIVEVLPESVRQACHLCPRREAFEILHFPNADVDIAPLNERTSAAHRTLIFEEIFVMELGLAMRRTVITRERGVAIPWSDAGERAFRQVLPFALTGAQTRVVQEIAGDLEKTEPMQRLVQGDVGSGKTAVAMAAAVQVMRAGYQVVFMAPTEILAEQHLRTITPWLTALGIPVGMLSGSVKGKERTALLAALASGELPCVVGTHALIEDDVRLAKCGLAIIDEQHRFGVEQRQALRRKAAHALHTLILTATPIPRTLAMTYYGDLDLSIIDELPPGRKPVLTKHYTESQRGQLYTGIRKELSRGRQGYVVYPLVAESEKVDLKNATDMAAHLTEIFGREYRVALLHGRMSSDEKDTVMQQFKSGAVQLLVTTSVVEVGVDVPNASVMIIEHAERFGLAQLHQLRGRVGRGEHQSYCILVANTYGTPEAMQRIQVMTESNDGFRIAEEDLKIRGPGEFLGTRQAGLPELRVARLVEDAELIATAREAAFRFLREDPQLARHPAVYQELMARWGARLQLSLVG